MSNDAVLLNDPDDSMDTIARLERTEVQEFTSGRRADVIIGGGIGGLAAATALTQKGLKVKLYERQDAFGEVGAGMQIASNCTRILDNLGLLDEAKRLGVVPERMIMRDAIDARPLLDMDLRRAEERYGHPYMVIHRSDLHGIFLRAAQRQGVELHGGTKCVSYEHVDGGARVTFDDGTSEDADVVIAADGIHSKARPMIVQDEPVSSAYVAYRGAVPIEKAAENDIDPTAVQVYIGPGCHFVQYALRAGEMFNQVAVFESPKALAGQDDWGTPDELDAAFEGTCEQVQKGLPLMWRDRWWRMFDRNPIMNWLNGRVALLGDAAHPPLQYMAQGAIMAIEDGWVLGEHVDRNRSEDGTVDWDAVLTAYKRGAARALPPNPVDRTRLGRTVAPARGGAPRAQRDLRRPRRPRLGVHRLGLGPDGSLPRGGAGDVHADPAGVGEGGIRTEVTSRKRLV